MIKFSFKELANELKLHNCADLRDPLLNECFEIADSLALSVYEKPFVSNSEYKEEALKLILCYKFLAACTCISGFLDEEVESAYNNIKSLILEADCSLKKRTYIGSFSDYERRGEFLSKSEKEMLEDIIKKPSIMESAQEKKLLDENSNMTYENKIKKSNWFGDLILPVPDIIPRTSREVDIAGMESK